jgi:hypothetical protein
VSFLDSGSRFYKASRGRIGAELVRLDDVETSEQLLVLDSLERSKSYRDLCKRWQWDIGESPNWTRTSARCVDSNLLSASKYSSGRVS